MFMTRRDFLGGVSASALLSGCAGFRSSAEIGGVLPRWRPGELELHFVYTGCGENMFYRLPDGTSILNDTGEFYRPRDLKDVPLLPSRTRLGGDWMTRYLHRVYDERTIDYAIFSHWHSDHIGHAHWEGDGKTDVRPNESYRYRVTKDGRKINGFLCVAEDFGFRRYFDHQYPARGTYLSQDSSMDLLAPWVEDGRKKGLSVEPFEVGALDQIALLRADASKYKGLFSIRNVCANGRMWDGGRGVIDFAADRLAASGKKRLDQNFLSLGFLLRYGKFSYWAGGDVSGVFKDKGGAVVDYEAEIGKRIGPVSVCKMNHHGCKDQMTEGFVRAVRAQAYVSCMWCPRQAHHEVLKRLVEVGSHDGGEPILAPQLVCAYHKEHERECGYSLPPVGASHVVVKVRPGGDAFKVYLLDVADESMRVKAVYERSCSNV